MEYYSSLFEKCPQSFFPIYQTKNKNYAAVRAAE
jgi:hypothetical protein